MGDWFSGFIAGFQKVFLTKNNWQYMASGLGTTLIVTFFALLIGIVLGLLLAFIRVAAKDLHPRWNTPSGFALNLLNKIAGLFITIIRGTPSMIQLMIMFAIVLASVDNTTLIAILTFGFNSSAYMAELFRGGIQSVDVGEMEAARSLGLTYAQAMQLVVLPQAFKNALPAFGNEVITLFKETAISGTIGLRDLTRGAAIIVGNSFNPWWPYLTAAVIYLLFVLLLERLFRYLEKRSSYAED